MQKSVPCLTGLMVVGCLLAGGVARIALEGRNPVYGACHDTNGDNQANDLRPAKSGKRSARLIGH